MDELDDFLNDVCEGTEKSEGGDFVIHPLGSFAGTVSSVVAKTTPSGKPVWELFVKTAYGSANFNIWGFTNQELAEGKQSQDGREKILTNIKRIKRIFFDLSVYPDDEIKKLPWSKGEKNVLNSFQYMIGKPCNLVIKTNINDSTKRVTYINKANSLPDRVDGAKPHFVGAVKPIKADEVKLPNGPDLSGVPF